MSAHSDYSESSFEPESILPSQFFEGRNKNEALEPTKRLMLAVLTDAVRCYQVGADAQKISRRRAFREAEEWLFKTISDGPFSFENVCCTLDIAPDYLRDALHKWQARRVRGARVAAVRRSPAVMSVRQMTTAIRQQPFAASLATLLIKNDSTRSAGLRRFRASALSPDSREKT